MAADEFTEVTQQGLGDNIKSSCSGAIFGLILFIGSFVLLFWNEGNAIRTAKSLEQGAANTVSVAPDRVDPANEGKPVHMTGKAQTPDTLADAEFGVSAAAIKLRRTVEMYQWKEEEESKTTKKVGGSSETKTTYKHVADWSETPNDSARFHTKPEEAQKFVNPPMPFTSHVLTAGNVTVGAFTLPASLIDKDSAFTPMTIGQEQLDKLPANLRAHAKLIQGGFYFSATTAAHPPTAPTPAVTPAAGPEAAPSPSPTASPAGSAIVGTPQIGDLRVTFSIVPPGDVSLIAQQAGNSFVPYAADAGEKIEMLTPGVKSAAEMYAQAQAENRFWTWILRLAGFLAMAIGLALTASPIRTVANILPFIGDVVGGIAGFVAFAVALPLSLITISIAWVYYRPIVGVPILIVGLAGIVGAFVLKAKKAKPKTV